MKPESFATKTETFSSFEAKVAGILSPSVVVLSVAEEEKVIMVQVNSTQWELRENSKLTENSGPQKGIVINKLVSPKLPDMPQIWFIKVNKEIN